MKNGDVIYATSHADFLNQAFGKNYHGWMRCTWNYDDEWVVWMVRFNKQDGGWTNTFLSNNRIKEEKIGSQRADRVDKKKIVIEIVDDGYMRKYIFRGKYVYDEKSSVLNKVRYYDMVSEEF